MWFDLEPQQFPAWFYGPAKSVFVGLEAVKGFALALWGLKALLRWWK